MTLNSEDSQREKVIDLVKASQHVVTRCYGFEEGVLKIEFDAIQALRDSLEKFALTIKDNKE